MFCINRHERRGAVDGLRARRGGTARASVACAVRIADRLDARQEHSGKHESELHGSLASTTCIHLTV